jgi:hypothetical protein
MTDTTHIVFGDMHNREYVVRDLFNKVGLIDAHGNRVPGFNTVQLGDRLSLGYGEQEASFNEWVDPFIDTQLVGNHEYPAIGPMGFLMEFVGWEDRDRVAEQQVRRDAMADPMRWRLAHNVGPWLITHAGLTPAAQKELGAGQTAAEYAEALNDLWLKHLTERDPDPLIIDARENGVGVLWNRLTYLRAGYRADSHVPQIVGHTPFDPNPKFQPPCVQNRDENLWAIDTPGSCAALVSTDEGQTWDLVQSDYEVRYDGNRAPTDVYDRHTGLVTR